MRIKFRIISFFSILMQGVFEQNNWSFASDPNWYAGEREVPPPVNPDQVEQLLKAISDMKRCNPVLLMIDGIWLPSLV